MLWNNRSFKARAMLFWLMMLSFPAQATTTVLDGLYRYILPSDFPNNATFITDHKALMSDASVGLRIDAADAQHGDQWVWSYYDQTGVLVSHLDVL